MNLYFLKHSAAVCLVSILGFMSYETAAYGDASLILKPHLANKDLVLLAVIFKPAYSVNIENQYDRQFYIIPDTYPAISIKAKFKHGPIEDFSCVPKNVTVKDKDILSLKVDSVKNRPDQLRCELVVTPGR